MNHKLRLVIISLLTATIIFVSCSDDKPTETVREGVYIELTAKSHIFYYSGMIDGSVRDSIIVRVDSSYAPDESINPISGLEITWDNIMLTWIPAVNKYIHQPHQFIQYETYQIFNITGSDKAEALVDSIIAPERMLVMYSPRQGAQIDRSQPLDILWGESGPGKVVIEIRNSNYLPVHTILTDDDGSHAISSTQLDDLPTGSGYIYLYKINQRSIDKAGYDSRSCIKAVVGYEINVTYL